VPVPLSPPVPVPVFASRTFLASSPLSTSPCHRWRPDRRTHGDHREALLAQENEVSGSSSILLLDCLKGHWAGSGMTARTRTSPNSPVLPSSPLLRLPQAADCDYTNDLGARSSLSGRRSTGPPTACFACCFWAAPFLTPSHFATPPSSLFGPPMKTPLVPSFRSQYSAPCGCGCHVAGGATAWTPGMPRGRRWLRGRQPGSQGCHVAEGGWGAAA